MKLTIVTAVGVLWLSIAGLAIANNKPLPFSESSKDIGSNARVLADKFVESQLN